MSKYHTEWVIQEVLCSPVQQNCLLGSCEVCGNGHLFFFRHPIPNYEDGETISFKVWMTDPDTHFWVRMVQTLTISDAIDRFQEKLPQFVRHYVTKRHQAEAYRAHLSHVQSAEGKSFFMIHFDYAENYKCATQDQIQAAYYSQKQVSLFTVVVSSGTFKKSLVLVSDNLSHGKESTMKYLLFLFEVNVRMK
jgi:hypothetical protein